MMDERRTLSTRVGPVPVRVIGDGPAVLGVHGLLLDGRLWDGMTRELAGSAHVVLPDLPLGAHRRAVPDRARLTPTEVAGALWDVLDGLGLDSAVLVGNDTGGALAQIAAAAHPERTAGLVLAGCDAFAHFPPPLLRPLPTLAALPGVTAALVRVFGVPRVLADPGRWNVFSTRGLGRPLIADLFAPARTDAAVREDLRAFLRAVRPAPLVAASKRLGMLAGRGAVVWAPRDRVFPPRDARRLAELLGTTVTWLDDALTFVPVDRPDAVADAVRRVLAASRPARPDAHAGD